MNQDQAEAIALDALGFIIQDEALRGRFLDLTGAGPADLRDRLSDSTFLAAIIEFLLGDEPCLLEFCKAAEIDPQLPARAHIVLAGHPAEQWG